MRTQSLTTEDYFPSFVKFVLPRVAADAVVSLIGFGENLKWLARIFAERGQVFSLHDRRPEFHGYDCCNKFVSSTDSVSDQSTLLIVCADDFTEVCETIRQLVSSSRLASKPTITYLSEYRPWVDHRPYAEIFERASERATSLNSPQRLFNLLQLVSQTADVDGDVVEFGTFSGGTAAIICEGLAFWSPAKQLLLFDSYEGLPTSPLGVDERWQGAFANVSRKEVEKRFLDKSNVRLVPGDIVSNLKEVPDHLSLVHVDVDTYFAAEKVTECVWPRLTPGGCLLFDDYGFFPNCIPLTAFADGFARRQHDAFSFYLPSNGFLLLKKPSAS